ncbi:MAG TPA: VanZ family protein [Candidatus Enterenecus stercoripullorum]|nr:VanZ family protein [Candidatus Enterenecus stercoripullorum]
MSWIDELSTHPILAHLVDMAPGVVLAALIFLCVYPWRKRRLSNRNLQSAAVREVVLLLFWMFCGGIAAITLTPRWFHWLSALVYGLPGYPVFSVGTVNLIPFQTFIFDLQYVILGNIVLFLPFGFFPTLLWRGFRWTRSLLLGVCVCVFIECWQLLIGRAFDIDDLILNLLGVLCGYCLSLMIRRLFPRFSARLLVTSSDSYL